MDDFFKVDDCHCNRNAGAPALNLCLPAPYRLPTLYLGCRAEPPPSNNFQIKHCYSGWVKPNTSLIARASIKRRYMSAGSINLEEHKKAFFLSRIYEWDRALKYQAIKYFMIRVCLKATDMTKALSTYNSLAECARMYAAATDLPNSNVFCWQIVMTERLVLRGSKHHKVSPLI